MKKITLLLISVLFTNCVDIDFKSGDDAKNHLDSSSSMPFFKTGDLMTNVSEDPMGNVLDYPDSNAAVTSQVKVWESGFKSPWHYHPYSGPAYIIQGELTVNYDTETSIDDSATEKKIIKTQTFKKGEAFLGIPNTWHVSENRGSEDLIFMIHWLGEKDKPVAFLEEK